MNNEVCVGPMEAIAVVLDAVVIIYDYLDVFQTLSNAPAALRIFHCLVDGRPQASVPFNNNVLNGGRSLAIR